MTMSASNNFEFNAHERGYLGLALSFHFLDCLFGRAILHEGELPF
jgi:hypothetical protein